MKSLNRKWVIGLIAVILLIVIGCSITTNKNAEESSAQQTLQAIYAQDTAEALAAQAKETPSETANAAFVEPEHKMTPGTPNYPEVIKNEVDTSVTAKNKFSEADSFRLGTLERPFTEEDMEYHPETDLIKLKLSMNDNFYFFDIHTTSSISIFITLPL